MHFLFIIIIILIAILIWIINAWRKDASKPKTTIIYQPPSNATYPLPIQELRQENNITEELADIPIIIETPPPIPEQLPIAKIQTLISFKDCPKCERSLPSSDFRPNHNTQDGLTKWCASCLDSSRKTTAHLKFCPKCGKNRQLRNFYKSKKNADGYTKWCKFCLKKHNKTRY